MKKKVIIIVIAIAVVAAGIVFGIVKSKKPADSIETETVTDTVENAAQSDESVTEDSTAETSKEVSEKPIEPEQSKETVSIDDKTEKTEQKKEEKQAKSEEAKKEAVPTFMFFASKKDSGYDEAVKAVEKLQSEYKGKVDFQIKDMDADSSMAAFLGEMETPALIMLDKQGNSTDIIPAAKDYDTMKKAIEKTLK